MKKQMDKIQFEYRAEIEDVMDAIKKYKKAYPQETNETVERLFGLLDVMDMEW